MQILITDSSLARTRALHFKRWQVGLAALLLAAVLLVAAAISWHIRELPAAPASHGDPARALGIWIGARAQGPASWLLAPFRALVHPAFASDLADFAARAAPAGAVAVHAKSNAGLRARASGGASVGNLRCARRATITSPSSPGTSSKWVTAWDVPDLTLCFLVGPAGLEPATR